MQLIDGFVTSSHAKTEKQAAPFSKRTGCGSKPPVSLALLSTNVHPCSSPYNSGSCSTKPNPAQLITPWHPAPPPWRFLPSDRLAPEKCLEPQHVQVVQKDQRSQIDYIKVRKKMSSAAVSTSVLQQAAAPASDVEKRLPVGVVWTADSCKMTAS